MVFSHSPTDHQCGSPPRMLQSIGLIQFRRLCAHGLGLLEEKPDCSGEEGCASSSCVGYRAMDLRLKRLERASSAGRCSPVLSDIRPICYHNMWAVGSIPLISISLWRTRYGGSWSIVCLR